MFSHLVHVLALSLAVSASKPQRVLGYHEEPSNFLQSSIFGRKDLAVQSLPEPVILKPSYESRDFQDNDEFAAQTFAHLPFIDCTRCLLSTRSKIWTQWSSTRSSEAFASCRLEVRDMEGMVQMTLTITQHGPWHQPIPRMGDGDRLW
jgi:hypothetical protein